MFSSVLVLITLQILINLNGKYNKTINVNFSCQYIASPVTFLNREFWMTNWIKVKKTHVFLGSSSTIISRSSWGARRAVTTTPLRVNPPKYVVIHHTDGNSCSTLSSCKSAVKIVQNYHMDNRKWSDIGYNFLVLPSSLKNNIICNSYFVGWWGW